MSTSTAQVLMRKGKRGAAAYIHADCADGSPQHLSSLLDVLLNPSKAIDEWETIDWCRWLIAGGRTPDEFAAIVRSYDKHDKCGLVWIPHVVAYRCRTCGISPCMSICRDCFRRGDHSTHDFNMFLSQAGGACDCGDKSVMKEDGFCSNHGNNCGQPRGSAPGDLMCVAEAMMPRVILRLLQHFRENSWGVVVNSDTYRIAIKDCEGYISMLMEFNNMGELMRKAMTKALINPQMYRNLIEPPFAETEYGCYMAESKKMYEEALQSFPTPDPPEEYRHLPALGKKLQHNTLLEEFIFWTFKYEFPQNVVCFLLNMLPDQDYKEHLTRTFVMHYARIPLVLEAASDPETLSNRVVHMSVQLFSNEALALRMVQQLHLLHVMVVSLRLMMSKILVQNTLHDPSKNFHYVIDCAQRVMKEHCYWPLVSDFNNVLSHRSVALLFLEDDSLIDMWFEFLSMLQGMNVNVRELGGHIEYEPSSYYAAFSCELEAAAYPMWSVIAHLAAPRHAPLARRMLLYCLSYLQEWLEAVHFTKPSMERTEVMHASFHYPLHRYYAAFLCAAVRCMGVRAEEVLPPADLLALLVMHPLRVQSLFYEILSGIWVRNGLQIKGQAMTYIQANFCNSMVDMDIYFLQVCAAHLPKDQFINTCIDVFGVREWLSMAPMTPTQAVEQDGMVEGLLTFLAILVSSRTNLGNDELTQSRLEISTLLATGDKTHSQLLELMPERSGNAHTRNFETVLKELSTYRPPPKGSENLEQGLFVPKPEVWEQHYDPLHVLQRAVHRRDFQSSMDRFTAYIQDKHKGAPQALWAPLRAARAPPAPHGDPRALCDAAPLHAALLAVLHRAVHRPARPRAARAAPPEHVLALALFLLEVAVDRATEAAQRDSSKSPVCQYGTTPTVVLGAPLLSAFAGASVCDNVRAVLTSVPLPPPPAHSGTAQQRDNYPTAYNSDSDTEWDASEADNGGVPGPAPCRTPQLAPVPTMIASSMEVALTGETSVVPTMEDMETEDRQLARLRTRSQIDDDLSMRDDDDDNYPLALPPIEDATNETMTVMVPTDMSVVESIQDDISSVSSMDGLHYITAPLVSGGGGSESGSSSAVATPPRSPARAAYPRAASGPTTSQAVVISGGAETTSSRGKARSVEPPQQADANSVQINESILSLLLKLHSQLSGCLDSFSLEEPIRPQVVETSDDNEGAGCSKEGEASAEGTKCSQCGMVHQADGGSQSTCGQRTHDSRIGDGPHFIGSLLRKLAALDGRCAVAISDIRRRLWPNQRERQAEQRARERKEKEERSRRARERQNRLMQDFAQRQKQFMNVMKAMETDEGCGMEYEEEEVILEKEYDCVICNTTSPSTETNPIGLVVLLQSTSVLGHRRRARSPRAALPLSDRERARQHAARADHDPTLAADHSRKQEELDQQFDIESWLLSVSVGWEGGVHVQSCGHHLHLHCLQAYLRSLTNHQRPNNLHIERGEFLCPVCRQLANSVLPLTPQLGRISTLARSQHPDMATLCNEIHNMLKDNQQAPSSSNLSEAMGKAMEDITGSTHCKFKHRRALGGPHQSIFTFVTSVARTNLEAELVQRGGTLVRPEKPMRYKPRKDCIVPLLHLLSMHARVLASSTSAGGVVASAWRELCPAAAAAPGAGPSGQLVPAPRLARTVPLLLRDPLALLMHFVLLAPVQLDMPYYTCMVRMLYNLTYYQVVAQLAAGMTAAGRASLVATSGPADEAQGLRRAARLLLGALAGSELFTEDGPPASASSSQTDDVLTTDRVDIKALELQLQELCLPFLRVAALLRHHLYREELPEIQTPSTEFVRLVYYLELVTEGMEWSSFSAWRALTWPEGGAAEARAVRGWAARLGAAAARCQIAVRRLLRTHHVSWTPPRLLTLPREYDRLFTYYHERVCQQCGAVPKEASVCLLCGTVVCLKQQCCRQQDVCEAVQHSIDCGGGTGIFLVVTSTYIIVIRGQRACLWGSLYLDDYDEEDRDLKRGKPLYLSEDRFELLESQWLAHRFDHTKRTWVWHRDSL